MAEVKTRRVRIVGDHPHRGESGTLILDPARMRQGMLPVDLDACAHVARVRRSCRNTTGATMSEQPVSCG